MSICPFLPIASFELAYELLAPYLRTVDVVAITACSKHCALHVLHTVVRIDRDGRVYSRFVEWPLRLSVWLRTSGVQAGDRVVRQQLLWCMNGARTLRTRMCRGCGKTTQRVIVGVTLCERCTRNRRLSCYMQSRSFVDVVLASILNVSDHSKLRALLSSVRWVSCRYGKQAFVSEVCRVIGISTQTFLSAEQALFSL